jgi:3-methyladenine DNA glycosylase AlkD
LSKYRERGSISLKSGTASVCQHGHMHAADVMRELESLGDEKLRRIYAKQGVGENQFGVKRSDLRTIAKRIKANPELARELWQTGNADAMLLAILLMKPKAMTADEVDGLVRGSGSPPVADWLMTHVVKPHPASETLRERWMQDDHPFALRAGWSLTAQRVAKDPASLDLDALLDRIEREIPSADEVPRWTMNACLAEIGIHSPNHRDRAMDIGERLGPYRDWPTSPGCTIPFAPIWIAAMVARQETP